jgi:acyl-coenzyme A synthetase/AMP-(fatty) acid ligase
MFDNRQWLPGRPFWPQIQDASTSVSVRERPILETLADIVRRHADRPALQDRDRTLSYRALWDLVGRIARAIAAAPAESGPVAIMLPADVTYFPAFLACLAVGRPSVLLDPKTPTARNADLIRQTGASLLLTAEISASDIRGIARLVVEADMQGGTDCLPVCPAAFDADAPALILCTSGSTGRPKAIVHSQRTIMQRAWCHSNAIGLRCDDFSLSLSPPATMGGINGLLTFAVAGAATRFFDLREGGFSGLRDALLALPVTSVRAPPSVLRVLPTLPDARLCLAGLRNVTTYGEAVLRADIAALRTCLPSAATIFNAYGSTEAGGMGWYPSADDAFDAARTPAGWVMPDNEAIILDDDGKPCGPEVDGELVVRSRYNALGEWQDGRCVPGQLIPDSTDPSKRIHRTGDIARRSAAGVFLVIGRNDRMIKVNGQRVEPAEIEDAIRRLPEVVECAVVSHERGTVVAVTAYVVLKLGVASAAGLGAALRGALPSPMVPSRFVPIATLPMLPGGKVDYLALKKNG